MRILLVVFSSVAIAQQQGPAPTHDLSGVWRWTRGVLTLSDQTPPMTAAGQAKFNANKPSYGSRAIPPALGNDPQGKCDPLGLPRLLFYGATTRIEIGQMSDRMVQFFEWGHVFRPIWTDGRELPKDPDPRWLGYSVGKWEGDTTFVVDSLGFDERTWIDHFGDPHSDEMRVQERYHRADRDTLELTVTLTDPKIYTKPWVSDTKIFKLQPKAEIAEIFCVPSEEEAFNRRMRDPAGGVVHK